MNKITKIYKSLSWCKTFGLTVKNFSTRHQFIMEEKSIKSHIDQLEVLHHSQHFLLVNKDYDVVLNSDEANRLSVALQIKHKYPELVNPSLVHGFYVAHRLDYSTSGILLVPLNKKAASSASKMFEKRKTTKFYLALVRGHLNQDKPFEINLPIGKDERPEFHKLRTCTPNSEYCIEPRNAVTKCVLLERGHIKGEPVSKVLLSPLTGRRHQLRVHLAEIGHIIVGDYTYSNQQDKDPYRMFLHAFRLKVPCSVESIDVQTKDPFTEEDSNSHWKVSEVICDIEHGMDLLQIIPS